jgi:L-gulonate 5-dehydrogenase
VHTSLDVVEEKLLFAKENGADEIVNVSNENLADSLASWTNNQGANVVIDCVCLPSTFAQSLEFASNAGTVVCLGFAQETAPIAQLPITKKQLTVVGSRLQSHQFGLVSKLIGSKQLRNDEIISHRFSFDEVKDAFNYIDENPEKVKKAILYFD